MENQALCWNARESSQNYSDLLVLCENVFEMVRTQYTWSETTAPECRQGECNTGLLKAEILHRFFKQRASPCTDTIIKMYGVRHTARLPEGKRKKQVCRSV